MLFEWMDTEGKFMYTSHSCDTLFFLNISDESYINRMDFVKSFRGNATSGIQAICDKILTKVYDLNVQISDDWEQPVEIMIFI